MKSDITNTLIFFVICIILFSIITFVESFILSTPEVHTYDFQDITIRYTPQQIKSALNIN